MMRLTPLLLLAGLAACSRGTDEARPGPDPEFPPVAPLPECPDADYRACDISEPTCQERLMSLAACVRRTDPVNDISIELMSPEQLRELFEQDLADFPEPAVPHFERALSVLGLADPEGTTTDESLDTRVDFLGGLYRATDKRLIMVDRGDPLDSVGIDSVLIHEMIHALQDADYDLTTWPEGGTPTFDSYLATDSLIEGEAKFYQYRVGTPMLGLDIGSFDFDAVLDTQLEQMFGRIYGSPTLYGSSFSTFPYGFGTIAAYQAWLEAGPSAIDALWASPPTTTRDVLAGVFRRDHEPVEVIDIPEPAVTSVVLDSQDSLGAWGVSLVLIAADAQLDNLTDVVLAWRGDHLWVYTDTASRATFGLWQVEMGSEKDATTLDDSFATLPGVRHGSSGTRAFASFGFQSPAPELTEWGQAFLTQE